MEKSVKIKMPTPPNYLQFEGGKGQADFGELTEAELGIFIAEYAKILRNHHKERAKKLRESLLSPILP